MEPIHLITPQRNEEKKQKVLDASEWNCHFGKGQETNTQNLNCTDPFPPNMYIKWNICLLPPRCGPLPVGPPSFAKSGSFPTPQTFTLWENPWTLEVFETCFFPTFVMCFSFQPKNFQETSRKWCNKISGDPNRKEYTFFRPTIQWYYCFFGQPHPVSEKNTPAMPLAWPKSAKSPDLKGDLIWQNRWWVVRSTSDLQRGGPSAVSLHMWSYIRHLYKRPRINVQLGLFHP